jgi:hypothetical protein
VNGHTDELRHCDTAGAQPASRRAREGKSVGAHMNSSSAEGTATSGGQRGPFGTAASILEGLPCIVVRRETPGV